MLFKNSDGSEGKKMDSVTMARHVEQLGLTGKSNLAFVIGGSLGLHKSTIRKQIKLRETK